MPDSLLSKALDTACAIKDESDRANALSGLAAHLPDSLLSKALQAACTISDAASRVHALIGLVPRLPHILPKALETAHTINDESSRAGALRKLIPYLPDILPEALEAAKAIQHEGNRADVLSTLAPFLPDILPEALEAAGAQDNLFRANTLRKLLPHINATSTPFSVWCKALHILAQGSREDMLVAIPTMSDAILTLGGTEALAATAQAIQDVCRQWR